MGDVSVTFVGTQAVVRLYGDVGPDLLPPLSAAREEVAALRPTRVAVDLDAVTSMDGCGVGFLLDLAGDCEARALPLRLVEVPRDVRHVLEDTGGGHLLARAPRRQRA